MSFNLKSSGALALAGIILPLAAHANNYYISQSGSYAMDASSVANAAPVSFFNTAANWSSVAGTAGKISPGDTVHIEGQITTALTIQKSGTAGNPITILFDSGAYMTAPYWSASGAINDSGFSYIVIDGGATGTIGGVAGNASKVNGYITATANGTNFANQNASVGVYVTNASNVTVQNLAVTNMYVRVGGTDESTNMSNTAGVWLTWSSPSSESNLTVTNCLFHDEFAGIKCYNYNGANINYSFITAYDCNWCAHVGDASAGSTFTGVTVHDCYFHDWANWDDSAHNENHHDGVFVYSNGGNLSNITIYNVTFGPNYSSDLGGTNEATAAIYINTWVYNVLIYNNTFIESSATDYPSDGLIYLFPEASITSTYNVFNNTFVGGSAGIGVNFTPQGTGAGIQTVTIENNLMDALGTFISVFDNATVSLHSDHNLAYPIPTSPFSWSPTSSSVFQSLSQWHTLGFDTGLITANPLLTNRNELQNASPAVDAGVSLASYFTTDAYGTARPQGSGWDIGAFELPQSTPVVVTSPSGADVAAGANATFTAQFLGAPTLNISWQSSPDGTTWTPLSNGTQYSGTGTPTLTVLSASSALNNLEYEAVATNGDGSATTLPATLLVQYAPTISAGPVDATIDAGDSTSFSVSAAGNPAPTYLWQYSTNGGVNWTTITSGNAGSTFSNYNTATLTVSSASSGWNGAEFQAVVSNGISPNATSSSATLTVDFAAGIATQPQARTITAGGGTSFTATVTGNPAPNLQWQVSSDGGHTWSNVSGAEYGGANSATLTIANAPSTLNQDEYELVATNGVGSAATTTPVTLTVDYAPMISTPPAAATVDAGGSTTFSVGATANPAPSYQWEYSTDGGINWTTITSGIAGSTYSNYTTANLTVSNVSAAMNTYEYQAVVTNTVSSTNSGAAILTVDFSPQVSSQTGSQTVLAGQNTTFSANIAANPAPASYQWQVNSGGGWSNVPAGAPYSGSTTNTLAISQASAGLNGYQYQLVATNTLGSITTNPATLTVQYAATFSTEPSAATVVEGTSAAFTIAASANPTPTIQWQISTDNGVTWSNLSNGTFNGVTYAGVTTNQLSITNTALTMNGDQIRAVASNSVTDVDSTAATLTVELNTPAITSAAYAGVTENAAFSYTITATNTPTSFTASPLPDGVTFDGTSGVLSGNPTTPGYYNINLGATNSHGTGTASLRLAVSPPEAPSVDSSTSTTALGGQAFSYTITGTNFPSSFATTTLPAGLTLNANTGVISGTPTVGGTYQVTLSATNPTGTGQGPLTIIIETMPLPTITSAASATAQVGTQFSYQIAGTYSPYILSAINLPPGLSVNSATGVISGIPTQAGTFTSTLLVTNATGTTSGALDIIVSSSSGVYLGSFGGSQTTGAGSGLSPRSESVGGSIAAYVNGSSTAGTLIGYIASIQAGFLVNFNLTGGAFTAQTTALTSNGTGQTLTFTGTITNGMLSGTIVELNLPFSAPVDPASGTSAALSGLYSSGTVYSVVGTQGDVYVLTVTPTGVAAGSGTINNNGQFTIQTPQGITVTASVSSQSGITGSISTGSQGSVSFSGSAAAGAPQITPASQTVAAGATVSMSAATTGATAYQWQYYGASIPGATSPTYTLANIGEYQGGVFTALVTTSAGIQTSAPATIAVDVDAHLVNISGRAQVTSSHPLIAGFVVSGYGSKNLLLRGVGPTLAEFSVSGALSAPTLTLFDQASTEIGSNTGWTNAITAGSSTVAANLAAATSGLFSQLGAFALPSGSGDSAIAATLPVGSYSEQVTGQGGASGVALAEIWDADVGTPTAHLANISLLAFAGTGQAVSTAGFVISGTSSETVLIRGIGPALGAFGISNTLTQPQLVLYDQSGKVIATNSGWGNAPQLGDSPVSAGIDGATAQIMSRVGAFSLPVDSADSAIVATLPPGSYTAGVTGVNGSTGTVLVEIYDVP